MDKKLLKQRISSLPQETGCYLYLNKKEHVIYVGKAKRLKSRVQSYFNSSQKSPKTELLVSNISDFQFILTDTEAEALILENNLIKKYNPKYNIQFRDDKSYPYVYCDLNEPFPRLLFTRHPSREGEYKIFGPFVTGSNIRQIMQLLVKLFRLRDCGLREFEQRKEPCLLFQMHQCSAPCVESISREDYDKDLEGALGFLEGHVEDTLKSLDIKMHDLAEKEEFEKAKIIRDSLFELDRFATYHRENNVEIAHGKDLDIIAWTYANQEIDLVIYMVRNGMLLGNRHFCYVNYHEDQVVDEVINGITRYYCNAEENLPVEIIVDFDQQSSQKNLNKLLNNAMKSLKDWHFHVSKSSEKTEKLMKLAIQQAQSERAIRVNNTVNFSEAGQKLAVLLQQSDLPRRMECYDVAIWQGSSPTASQVVFIDGKPSKKDYRYYHLEEVEELNNDFVMMSEVFTRRLKRGQYPDLFVVDGGIGQVNTVKKILLEKGIDIPLVGIAKSRIKTKDGEEERTEERLFIFGKKESLHT